MFVHQNLRQQIEPAVLSSPAAAGVSDCVGTAEHAGLGLFTQCSKVSNAPITCAFPDYVWEQRSRVDGDGGT